MLYSIYTLSNPGTGEIFYVGCTSKAERRAYQHSYKHIRNHCLERTAKDLYILQLMCDPVFHVIEEIEAPVYNNKVALDRESFWIAFLQKLGFPLVNDKKKKYESMGFDGMAILINIAMSLSCKPKQIAA